MGSTRSCWHSRGLRSFVAALGALVMVAGVATTGGAKVLAAPKELETIDVPPLTPLDTITSETVFKPKKTYSITVTGTVTYATAQGTSTVDGVYCVTGPACEMDSSGNPLSPPTWHNGGVLGIRDAGNLFSSLDEFMGCCPLKRQLDYSDTHTYTISFKGIAGPIQLYDPRFETGGNAQGSWQVVIFLGKVKPASPTCKPDTPLGFPEGCPEKP